VQVDGDDGRPPPFPTGRVPQWVLDEQARSSVPPAPPRPRGAVRRAARRGLTVLVLVPALGLGAGVLTDPGSWSWTPTVRETLAQPSTPPTPSPEDGRLPDRPAPGVDAAPDPRGVPLPPPPEGGSHAFIAFQADGVTPVAYDPCRPIHYVIRPDSAPPGGEELVREAMARIAEVTGFQFVYRGPTDETPAPGRELFQPDRYGRRWAPVLVAWETEEQNPALAGDVVGQAGSVPASLGDGARVYLTGTVSLDAPRLTEILRGRDGRRVARSIVLHELGHLMGLAHVDDENQLMFPEARREVPDFAAGDLTGLAALGAGPCVPEL
jgi:Matrixin